MIRSSVVRIALVVLVVTVGCWQDAQPAVTTTPTIHKLGARRLPASHHTVWEGKYTCAQGVTGLHLELDTASNGVTTGIFVFYGLAQNPWVPRGSYRLRGLVTMSQTGSFALALAPDGWITESPGYLMVGLQATSDRERRSLSGRLTDPSCAVMALARVQ